MRHNLVLGQPRSLERGSSGHIISTYHDLKTHNKNKVLKDEFSISHGEIDPEKASVTVPLLSTLNEDVDPNNYLPEELELSIEHTQSIERLHERVGKLLSKAAPLLKKVASKSKNLIKRIAALHDLGEQGVHWGVARLLAMERVDAIR